LLPQSSAATTSVTNAHEVQRWYLDVGRNQRAHGVIGAHQKIGQMGVQAFDPDASAAHAAARRHEVASHDGFLTLSRVFVMGSLEVFCIDQLFITVHASTAFQAAHLVSQLRVNEPVQGRHRRAVTQVRFIFNDDRPAVESTHHHGASASERTAEQLLYDSEIVG
jgi:hypothetical protein